MDKVSESQKQFFLETHCPRGDLNFLTDFCPSLLKWVKLKKSRPPIVLSNTPNYYIRKMCVYSILIWLIFWAMEFQEKNAFEISWPLVIFLEFYHFAINQSELLQKEITAKLKNVFEAWKLECNLMHLKNSTNTVHSWFT